MKHFELYHKPHFSAREYLLPFLLQYAVLLVCIRLHRLFIYRGPLVGEAVMAGDEMSSPTAGRLAFCILSFVLCTALAVLASRKAKEGGDLLPYLLGSFSGTFFWQSLGEDAWNFAIGGVNFVQLESVSVFPLFLVAVLFLIYAVGNRVLDWGIWCVVLGFLANWWGHYVMLGTYPFVAAYFEEAVWNRSISTVVGALLLATGLYLGLCSAKDKKGRIFAAMVTYIATGVIAFGMMEG